MAMNLKKHPKATHKERLEGTGLQMCRATIDGIAKEQGFGHMLARRPVPKEKKGRSKAAMSGSRSGEQSCGVMCKRTINQRI